MYLVTSSGVRVSVADEKAARLIATGNYTAAEAAKKAPAKPSASKKAPAKKAPAKPKAPAEPAPAEPTAAESTTE